MTAEAAGTSPIEADDGRMFCYRHPDRETWVRCGRCDRPICSKCAMLGPVGMRCRDCGKPVRDALSSLTPRQVLAAAGIALGGGALVGYLGIQIGFFMILVGFFGGGIIAEAIDRAVGVKRGPRMLALVMGGIAIGAVIGSALALLSMWRQFAQYGDVPLGIEDLILTQLPWMLIGIGATVVGAYGRMR